MMSHMVKMMSHTMWYGHTGTATGNTIKHSKKYSHKHKVKPWKSHDIKCINDILSQNFIAMP
jgi:hypothetical protein